MTGPSTAPSTQQGLGISAEPSGGQMAGPSPGLSSEPTVSADPARRLGIPALSGDLAEEFRLFMEFKQFSEMLKDASLTTVATAGPAVQAVQPPPLWSLSCRSQRHSQIRRWTPSFGQYPSQQAQLLQRAVQPAPLPPVLAPLQPGNTLSLPLRPQLRSQSCRPSLCNR